MLAGLLAVCACAGAADDDVPAPVAKGGSKGQAMDYGPFQTYSLLHPAGGAEPVPKGLVVHLGGNAHACFDSDLLRWATVWTGPGIGLDLGKTNLSGYKGSARGAALTGVEACSTAVVPGWCSDGAFTDPRPNRSGPLPRAQGRWRGLFRHGDQVVLAYQIGNRAVLDLPGRSGEGDATAFTRTLRIDTGTAPLHLLIGDLAGAKGETTTTAATLSTGTATLLAVTVGAPAGARLTAQDGRLALSVPALSAPTVFTVAVWRGAPAGVNAARARLAALPQAADPTALCTGGPARWAAPLAASIQRGDDDGAWAVDTVALPETNPWQAWMRPTGLDFLPDGRIALCTMNGDVWIATVSASGTAVTWRRFAAGLYEPLGLCVANGLILVTGRDQITRLRDLDRDGEADHYECFNNDRQLWPNYHTFAFDLQRDRAGNFYYIVGNNWAPPGTPGHNCLLRVSPDGERSEVVATGFRAPNGMSIGPNDEITCGDNQGQWVPSSKVMLVKPGAFHGAVTDPRQKPDVPTPPADPVPPLCWLPTTMDNSSGGQVWVTSDRWGPFNGGLLHLSYGKSALFAVLRHDVGGVAQAAAVRFPLQFAAGIMRGRFSPDGDLWLTGMKGWQTNAAKDGCLHRVRSTGKPVLLPVSFAASAKELRLGFAVALDPASAGDARSYAVQRWNYKWTATYGSDLYSVTTGAKGKGDTLTVTAARLDADGRTLVIAVDDLRPCMQQVLTVRIKTADGAAITVEVPHTIHKLP